MVNSIKLEDINPGLAANAINKTTTTRASKQERASSGNAHSISAENADIVVTSHMNKLVNIVMGQSEAPDENARVQAAKSQVESNEYQVNVPGLADKLMSTVLANS